MNWPTASHRIRRRLPWSERRCRLGRCVPDQRTVQAIRQEMAQLETRARKDIAQSRDDIKQLRDRVRRVEYSQARRVAVQLVRSVSLSTRNLVYLVQSSEDSAIVRAKKPRLGPLRGL